MSRRKNACMVSCHPCDHCRYTGAAEVVSDVVCTFGARNGFFHPCEYVYTLLNYTEELFISCMRYFKHSIAIRFKHIKVNRHYE